MHCCSLSQTGSSMAGEPCRPGATTPHTRGLACLEETEEKMELEFHFYISNYLRSQVGKITALAQTFRGVLCTVHPY